MSTRAASGLAWGLWAACVALVALGLLFAGLNRFATSFAPYLPILFAGTLSFSTVGALVASRHRKNALGWLLCASGLLFGITAFGGEYGFFALFGPQAPLTGGVFALWVGSWSWLVAGSLVLYSFLFFPDGRLPSRRWRALVPVVVLAVCFEPVRLALRPGRLEGVSPPVENPFAAEDAFRLLELVGAAMVPLWVAVSLTPVVALVVRFRRMGDEGRQQIKWVAYAVALLAGVITAEGVWPSLDGSTLGLVLFLVGYQAIPVAIGVAVLRYRLYDIDLIINRTLVYAVLTSALALVYFGGVAFLQLVLRPFTGGESQLAVVASTLAIAALFSPLRRRIQSLIDRQFYRKKYDAQETLSVFGARLRDETDLEALSDELVGVVRETMEPEHASLWLRPVTGPAVIRGERGYER